MKILSSGQDTTEGEKHIRSDGKQQHQRFLWRERIMTHSILNTVPLLTMQATILKGKQSNGKDRRQATKLIERRIKFKPHSHSYPHFQIHSLSDTVTHPGVVCVSEPQVVPCHASGVDVVAVVVVIAAVVVVAHFNLTAT